MNELWRVQLGTGEVRMMTIDELDRAFDAGFIHSRTNVLAPGSFKWTTLGEAAGLDEQPYVEQTPSLAPMAIAGGGASQYSLPQMPAYQPYAVSSMGLDDDDLYPKRSKKGIVFGFMVAAVAGACAFLVTTGKLDSLKSTIASTHTESKAAAATLAPAAEQKLPEAAKPAEAPKPAESPAVKITDDMKKKLLEADKEREAKVKAKAEKAGKNIRRRVRGNGDGNSQPKQEGQKLIEGGDKFDPLNASI